MLVCPGRNSRAEVEKREAFIQKTVKVMNLFQTSIGTFSYNHIRGFIRIFHMRGECSPPPRGGSDGGNSAGWGGIVRERFATFE